MSLQKIHQSMKVRKTALKMVVSSKASHIGSPLLIVDILSVLYFDILRISKNDLNYISSLISKSMPSIEKLKKINYSPVVNLENGFKRTIDYYLLNKISN
mgnify:FL=1